MHAGKLVFSQVMELLPWRRFETCDRRYDGDRKIKSFPCSEHLRVMAFAQLAAAVGFQSDSFRSILVA